MASGGIVFAARFDGTKALPAEFLLTGGIEKVGLAWLKCRKRAVPLSVLVCGKDIQTHYLVTLFWNKVGKGGLQGGSIVQRAAYPVPSSLQTDWLADIKDGSTQGHRSSLLHLNLVALGGFQSLECSLPTVLIAKQEVIYLALQA